MWIVKFNNRSYHFDHLVDAKAFAKTWGEKPQYQSLCGDHNCRCESLCKSFHAQPNPKVLGHEAEDYQLNN